MTDRYTFEDETSPRYVFETASDFSGGNNSLSDQLREPPKPETLLGYLDRRTAPKTPAATLPGRIYDQTIGRASRAVTEMGKDLIGGGESELPGGAKVPDTVAEPLARVANPIPETPMQAGAMVGIGAAGPLVNLAARYGVPVATLQAYPWLARVLGGTVGGEVGGEAQGLPAGKGALHGGGPTLAIEAAMPVAAKVFRSTAAGARAVNAADARNVGEAAAEVAPTLQPGVTANAMQRTAEGQGLARIGAGKETAVQDIEAALNAVPGQTPQFVGANGQAWVYANGAWQHARPQGAIPIPSMGRSMTLRDANAELSSIGDQMRGIRPLDPRFPRDVDLRAEYGQLAEDIRNGIAQVAGPQVAAQWTAAQGAYRAGREISGELLSRPNLFRQGEFTMAELQRWLRNPDNRAELARSLGGDLGTGQNLGPYNRLVNTITRGAEPGMVDELAGRAPGLLSGRGSYGGWRVPFEAIRRVLPNASTRYVSGPTGRVPYAPRGDIQTLLDLAAQGGER